jgi:acyl-CoA dehydrogenase
MLSLGGYLKKKENLSARLGDVLSCMYLASMVLKHYENRGCRAAELPIVEWACRNLLYRAQEELHVFLRNFPNRILATLMRVLIFPRGLTYSAPSDSLGGTLAHIVMNAGEARSELCTFIYKTEVPGNALGELEAALRLAPTCETIEKRIRVEGVKTGRVTALDVPGQIQQALAAEIISPAEAEALRAYDARIMEIIGVDDFAPHELGAEAQPHLGAVPKPDVQVA